MKEKENSTNVFEVGDWHIDLHAGVCESSKGKTVRLEPKSCAVLQVLIRYAAELVTKEALIEQAWPGQFASDETLLRTISRIRATLNDNPKAPTLIETVPKRGYRLIANVQVATPEHATSSVKVLKAPFVIAAIALLCLSLGAWWIFDTSQTRSQSSDLLAQADDFYHQMRLADNEMAISLYEQHINLQPDAAAGYAGLANALVQRAVRYTGEDVSQHSSLTEKVAAGVLENEDAQNLLRRAQTLANRAVDISPHSAVALKSLGFVLSAGGEYEQAIAVYERALDADPEAWQVLINIGELYSAMNLHKQAVESFEKAFHAMETLYAQETVQIRPWIADMGNLIGNIYYHEQQLGHAEAWYRRALQHAPLHEQATLGLSKVLALTGDTRAGLDLCLQLEVRLQKSYACQGMLTELVSTQM